MDSVIIPYRSGRIAVLADLHWDSYERIIVGDLANGPPLAW